MTKSQLRCTASTSLSVDEIRLLEELPDPAHELEQVVECELEAEHVGRHAALCQASGGSEVEWWIQWTDGGDRNLASLKPCEAELSASADQDASENVEEVCELAVDHAGGHSFHLAGTPGGRTPSPMYQDKIEALLRSSP